jgi:hypothetical protein
MKCTVKQWNSEDFTYHPSPVILKGGLKPVGPKTQNNENFFFRIIRSPFVYRISTYSFFFETTLRVRVLTKQWMKYSAASALYSPDFNKKLRIFCLILRVIHLKKKEPYNGADLDRDVRSVKNAALNHADFEAPDRNPPPYCKTTSSLKGFMYFNLSCLEETTR